MCDIIKKPSECSQKEKKDFYDLVVKGNQVNISRLKERIEGAELLAFHYEKNNLVGIAALKYPNESYKNRIFEKAEVPQESGKYKLEFGWAYTELESEGRHICSNLTHKMLESEVSQNIYATTKDKRMQKILTKNGFKTIGKPYPGEITKDLLLLFTKEII